VNGISIACSGRLGNDPELKYSGTGKPLLTFSVAVDANTRATEDRPGAETLWLRCTAWETQAEELAETLRKGALVYIEGRLSHGTWETPAGERRCGLNVSCWTVQPMGQIGRRAPKREPAVAAAAADAGGALATSGAGWPER
jgi:single-strand DNA-binding protein